MHYTLEEGILYYFYVICYHFLLFSFVYYHYDVTVSTVTTVCCGHSAAARCGLPRHLHAVCGDKEGLICMLHEPSIPTRHERKNAPGKRDPHSEVGGRRQEAGGRR